jgi:uncharacterized protein YegL
MAAGHAAGDITTGEGSVRWTETGGVDCAGFVSRVWRTGTRFGTSKLFSNSRPIKFEELRAGDMLERYGNVAFPHVMLFKEFVQLDGTPIPLVTRIRVYEAALYGGKVSEREYLLVDLGESTQKWWRGALYETNEVTLRRMDDGFEFDLYVPRTYLNPIDIVLVIDRSGSMRGDKIGLAKEAAKMFVDQMRTGDKIGVVGFDTTASVEYPSTEIDSEGAVKAAARDAIDTLSTQGLTSVGGGLLRAQEELNASGPDDPVRLMVLLSDGYENRPPYVEDVLPSIVADSIVVHTVGLGSGADQDLLNSIADQTGGIYRFASATALIDIYNAISAKVYGETVARTISGTVPSGETVEETVPVDSSVGSVTFSLFWPGSDLDLTLVQPDGRVIDVSVADTDPHISFTSGETYEFYEVYAPQYGEWTMRIFRLSDGFNALLGRT